MRLLQTRFTLQVGQWYAAELIGDEFCGLGDVCSHSPIRVDGIKKGRNGKRCFELSFYHANYPEGVRDKTYSLQTIERGDHFF